MIPDLRHLNEGRPEVYNAFWAVCAQYIEEMSLAAADDRRHDSVVHLATALSAPDMHKAVSAKLPPSVARPSVKWLYLQFWPKDPTRRSAIHHTGRLDIKFMVHNPDSFGPPTRGCSLCCSLACFCTCDNMLFAFETIAL